MVFNPRWLNWSEEDEEGNLIILKENIECYNSAFVF